MGIGKGSVPSAPIYSPTAQYAAIAQSDANIANYSSSMIPQQMAWAQQTYGNQLPYTTDFMNQMASYGRQAAGMQSNAYFPVQNQFVQSAMNFNSPAQQAQASALAQQDVANTYMGQRQAALQDLESYGIDPSQTRFGALDLGTRITQAANMASAGTQARLNSQMTGLNLEQAASNMGFQQAGLQQSAGQAGVGAGISTANLGANLLGTPQSWAGTAMNANTGVNDILSNNYRLDLAKYQQQAQTGQQGSNQAGQAVGAVAGVAAIAI
jgi:hypothetical protein